MVNEATDTDLKIIEKLQELGWRRGDTLFYQESYTLTAEQQKNFIGHKSIKPDIILKDLNETILAVFENKLQDEKQALVKLRSLYAPILKPRFLYACSQDRILFYDTEWKEFEVKEFRSIDYNSLMTLEDMQIEIEHTKHKNSDREIIIDKSIAGGKCSNCGKERYFQIECIEFIIKKYREGKQKMLVHMATGLGKTRTAVALVKALLEYNMAKKILFVVDRILLADQALNDGFSLIGKQFSAVRITSSNYKQYKHTQIHIVVIDTLENIYDNIPSGFYDLLIVDECHRSININRKLIFDHFLCPRLGLTATPKTAIAKEGSTISEEDLAILDTYKLFDCEYGEPDYQFDLQRGIEEGFLAPYSVLEIETELTKIAKEKGIEFDHYADSKTGEIIQLDDSKKIEFEQLNKKFIARDNCLRIAEELKKQTQYGEKVILFGVSQAHCLQLVKAINQVFSTKEDELSPRYAEAIISDNNDLNATFKKWFKEPNRKPYIAVSVDIMSTGVDIPCVRYITFANITKSVGKYIQMLGRGTRLDLETGKNSFKILDFTGICKEMNDNGRGTEKKNEIIPDDMDKYAGNNKKSVQAIAGIIDNPDPAHLIQRYYLHENEIRVIDNIPIEKAREIFETEAQNTTNTDIIYIKESLRKNKDYTLKEDDINKILEWTKAPEVYLGEGDLQRIYDYPQGSILDFFLNAINIRKIPTPKERIEKGFDSYIKTYNFSLSQTDFLRKIKGIFTANVLEKKEWTIKEIFEDPVYSSIIKKNFNEINKEFNGNLQNVFNDLQKMIGV